MLGYLVVYILVLICKTLELWWTFRVMGRPGAPGQPWFLCRWLVLDVLPEEVEA